LDVVELNPEEIALVGGFCDLVGGSFWLQASMIVGGGSCPFLVNLAFVLQLKKKTKKTSVRVAGWS
jgi:hypothetical protein